jgi:multiple sugar transport system ATP-binding protein
MSAISIQGIRKDFKGQQALKSIDLEVKDQEFCVLLGPSGCGKTTLMRIIAGLETETSGEVLIGGKRMNGLPPRARNIAMVFQNYAVFPHMTIEQNIGFGLRMKKVAEDKVRQQVQQAAEMMHIEHLLQRYAGQLSGGQRQRVAVARALAVQPDVLLMDEPLSNLDALLRLEMRSELKGLLRGIKTTTIYVTHDQTEAMSLADRIAVMHGGEIVQYAQPAEVYDQPANQFVGGFIGNPPMNFVTDVQVQSALGCVPPAPGLTLGIRPRSTGVGAVWRTGARCPRGRNAGCLAADQYLGGRIAAARQHGGAPHGACGSSRARGCQTRISALVRCPKPPGRLNHAPQQGRFLPSFFNSKPRNDSCIHASNWLTSPARPCKTTTVVATPCQPPGCTRFNGTGTPASPLWAG